MKVSETKLKDVEALLNYTETERRMFESRELTAFSNLDDCEEEKSRIAKEKKSCVLWGILKTLEILGIALDFSPVNYTITIPFE